jgi:ACS family hexuronate transporter-like MFS transporter
MSAVIVLCRQPTSQTALPCLSSAAVRDLSVGCHIVSSCSQRYRFCEYGILLFPKSALYWQRTIKSKQLLNNTYICRQIDFTMTNNKMTNYRWVICAMLFFATTVNYLDRQVLSLLQPLLEEQFHWTDTDYGNITGVFSLFYAVCMLFAGRFVDKVGTKRGYAWAIAIWSVGAAVHAVCGTITKSWLGIADDAALRAVVGGTDLAAQISLISVTAFIVCRCVLALGEAGNFPAAIKATAEYFPKKDRAFATGIFNSGANVGAIIAPLSVPFMAEYWGWEAAFIITGMIGFVWLGIWLFVYKRPEDNASMNEAERAYILQDDTDNIQEGTDTDRKIPFLKCLTYRQTWAFAFGKFMTDGVWWFFLFWTPAYLKAQYGMEGTAIAMPIAVLYSITVIGSVFGGKFPTYFINKGMNPYSGRMLAMLIIAFFPLFVLLAQPLGYMSFWAPILLIAVGASAHQAWSANIFSTVGDMFPKGAIATVTGIGGMAGGVGSFFIQRAAGQLFTFSDETQMVFMGFEGKSAGYAIAFIFCALAYIIAWCVMKALVPKYKLIR